MKTLRPTGTVTFLFSDIEGSTARWEADRKAMESALVRHDALMRAALVTRGGYIFKTMGDAFCATFARAQDAISAALDAQRALAAEDFSGVNGVRVRMAIHTGTADEREGDYFGPAVNRVARLLAIGHGGQVLLSGAAAHLLQGEMPPDTGLCDLGAHRLKDLARPEHVYQLVAPDLPEQFSALHSLDELPNNLPRQFSSFVGRDEVVAQVAALIEKFRLVTLVGTGGVGKTRCAIQVGAEMLDGSADGVWFAELAPISDASLVAGIIARVLNVQGQPSSPILETLLLYLKRKRLLLIVDNCEHVIDQARTVIHTILRACPDVRILATSREALNIPGEHAYRMPSLPVPTPSKTETAENLQQYGAVALFTDRALTSDTRFRFTDENAPHVADICRRLDGIPLAIELAAARVRVLSPKELAKNLDERFRVLTGGDRTALPRQHTMRALIDWSYDLLSGQERAMFRKLSIFAGAFTLESATAVSSNSEVDDIAVLDLLTALVDKSLVQTDTHETGLRYRLLESTRQYAREKLSESSEYDAVARAHAIAFLELAQRFDASWEATPEYAASAQIELELENLRAALSWAFGDKGDALIGQQIAGALGRAWEFHPTAEAERWMQAAQSTVSAQTPEPLRAALDLAQAQIAGKFSHHKISLAAAQRALARFRELGDALQIAWAQMMVGISLVRLGEISKGETLLRQTEAAARELGARRLLCIVLRRLADTRRVSDDVVAARDLYVQALAIARAIGSNRAAAGIAGNLAEAEFRAGDAPTALRLAREALDACRQFNDMMAIAASQSNIAAYLVALGRFDEARTCAREAITGASDARWEATAVLGLQHMAAVGALGPSDDMQPFEQRARAARLLGYVDARLSALDALREYTERQEYDAMISSLRNTLGENALSQLMIEGSTWTEDQAVADAMRI